MTKLFAYNIIISKIITYLTKITQGGGSKPLQGSDSRIKGNIIAIRKNINTSIEKLCNCRGNQTLLYDNQKYI